MKAKMLGWKGRVVEKDGRRIRSVGCAKGLGERSVQSRVLGKAGRSKKYVVSPICLSSEGGVGMAELGTEWAREKSSKL